MCGSLSEDKPEDGIHQDARLWHLFIASAIRLNSHKVRNYIGLFQPSNARGTVGNSAVDAVAEAAKLCGSLGHHLEQASPEFDAVANGVNLSPLKHVRSIEWDNFVLWRLVRCYIDL